MNLGILNEQCIIIKTTKILYNDALGFVRSLFQFFNVAKGFKQVTLKTFAAITRLLMSSNIRLLDAPAVVHCHDGKSHLFYNFNVHISIYYIKILQAKAKTGNLLFCVNYFCHLH